MTPAATIDQQSAPAPVQPTAEPRRLGLRTVLILLGAMEALDAFLGVKIMFGDMSLIPGTGFGRFLVAAHLAALPVLSAAVIVFAIIGRIRFAIMALAAIALMSWLRFMPTLLLRDFGLTPGPDETLIRLIVLPLMAAGAMALARYNKELWLAAVLAGISTLYIQLQYTLFFIGVMIYGF